MSPPSRLQELARWRPRSKATSEIICSVWRPGLGMQTDNEHFVALGTDGIVAPGEAYTKSNDQRALKEQFGQRGIKRPSEMTAELSFE